MNLTNMGHPLINRKQDLEEVSKGGSHVPILGSYVSRSIKKCKMKAFDFLLTSSNIAT